MPVPFIQLNPVSNQDAGTAAMLSALTNALSTQAYTANSKRSMLADLLGKGISAGGTLLGNGLGFLASQNQARNTLQTAGELGVIPPLSEEQLSRGIAQSGANTIVGQAGYNALLGRANKIANTGDSLSKAGDPRGDIAYDQAGNIIDAYANRSPVNTTINTPLVAEALDTSGQAANQTYIPGKPLKGGVVSAPVPAEPQNLVAQTAKIDKDTKALQLQGEKINQSFTNPDYLYGTGNSDRGLLSQQIKTGAAPEATDSSGVGLGMPMNLKLSSSREALARMPQQKQADIYDSVDDAALTADKYLRLRDQVLNYQRKGLIGRLRTKIATSGLVSVVLPDNPSEADLAVKQFADARNAMAIKLAKATGQAANSISDKDAASFKAIQGDPNGSRELFLRQSNALLADFLVPAIPNAANVNADQFQKLNAVYEQLAGKPYNYETPRILDETNEAFNRTYKNKEAGDIKASVSRSRTQQPASPTVAPSARTTATPVARPSSPTKSNLTDIEKILQQYGRI